VYRDNLNESSIIIIIPQFMGNLFQQGLTALHYAIKAKNWGLSKLLLESKNLNANSKDHLLGRTPLHAMIASIHTDLTGKF